MTATCIYCDYQVRHGARYGVLQKDAYRALIEHDWICPKNPIARERDELAAHVWRFLEATSEEALADDDWTFELDEVRNSSPAASLARRDARVKAEGLEEMAEVIARDDEWTADWLRLHAKKLHRQAKEGE